MKGIRKIWLRFWVIFLIQIIIKSFDQSFPAGPFELNVRSLVFTLFFVGYGLIIWRIADYFNQHFRHWTKNIKRVSFEIIIISFLHAILGFALAFSLNHLYRLGDTYLFDKAETWEKNSLLNPELTISLTIIYLLILALDGYYEMQKNFQNEILRVRNLEKENILAQYKALKAQIEPHFLFNSLSVLSSLVYEDADLSADFILKLSKTLRYVIEKNEFHLVKLSDELEFLESYFFLIKIRFEDGVFLDIKLDKIFTENAFIPPVTLQHLVENAINHNKCNPNEPLKIAITKKDDFIEVKNNLNKRDVSRLSTQTGLKNLADRYDLVSKKEIIVHKSNSEFLVKIPVLNHSDYERFDIGG